MKSYFIDTNYLLRLLLKDNKEQFDVVYNLFKSASNGEVKIVTSVVVFFEIYWVLTSFYGKDKKTCFEYLVNLLRLDFFEIEDKEVLMRAVKLYEDCSLGLEDCFNIYFSKQNKTSEFATFDKRLLKYVLN